MLTSAELKETQVFSCLKEADLLWLSQHTADLHREPGEYLIHEGEPSSFFVLIEGATEVVKDIMGRRTEVTQHKARNFFGELPILMATAAPASVAQRRFAVWRGSIRSISRSDSGHPGFDRNWASEADGAGFGWRRFNRVRSFQAT